MAAAWVGLLLLVAFGPVVLRRETLLPWIPMQSPGVPGPLFLMDPRVPALYGYPLAAVIQRGWRQGGPPLWSSLTGCGEPLAAEAEPGVFAPLRLWAAVTPPTPGLFDAWALLRLALAGLGAWWWAAVAGLGPVGRAMATAGWMLSGFWVANVSLDSMDAEVWLPVLGAAVLHGLRSPGRWPWLAAVGAGGAFLLVGNPEAAIADGLFLAGLVAARAGRGGLRPGAVTAGLGAMVGALALAAPVWIPLAEFFPRAQHVHHAVGSSFIPLRGAVSLVLPRALGAFSTGVGGAAGFLLPWIGLVSCLLVGWGVRTGWRSAAGPALCMAPVGLLAMAFGLPPLSWLTGLPPFSLVWWAKYQAPTYLAAATLAGFGADRIARAHGTRAAVTAVALAVLELVWLVPRLRGAPRDPLVPAFYVRYLQGAMNVREERCWATSTVLGPHGADALGLPDARTYYALYPRRAYWYGRALVTGGPAQTTRDALLAASGGLDRAGAPALTAMAVKWLVTRPDTQASRIPAGWVRRFAGEMAVWERAAPVARAFIAGRAVRMAGPEAALLATSERPADHGTVFVEGPPDWGGFAARSTPSRASIIEDLGMRLAVALPPANGPRVLVLADTWEPGWKAFAGGGRIRVLPANCMFRAVVVPPGAARVDFRYDPLGFKCGVWWCGLALGLLAAVAASPLRRGE